MIKVYFLLVVCFGVCHGSAFVSSNDSLSLAVEDAFKVIQTGLQSKLRSVPQSDPKQTSNLWCYDCTDPPTGACADPVNTGSIGTKNCGLGTVCYKVIASSQGVTATIRDCTYVTESCSDLNNLPGITINSCNFCSTNYCNGSIRVTAGILSLLPLLISYFLAAKLL
ncbi:hypothetical protein DMENIID0001_167370 [Sergentomyia squamirostris]